MSIALLWCIVVACVRQKAAELPPVGGFQGMIFVVVADAKVTVAASSLAGDPTLPVVIDESKANKLYALLYDRPLDALALSPGPLTLAQGCGRPLPQPSKSYGAQVVSGVLSGWTETDLSEVPVVADLRLQATGMCASVFDAGTSYVVDARCTVQQGFPKPTTSTGATSASQNGCALQIATSDPDLGTITGFAYELGATCFNASASLGTCANAPAPPGTAASFLCKSSDQTCALDVYPAARSKRIKVDRVPIISSVPSFSANGFERPPRGYLGDVVALADRVAVIAYPSELRWSCTSTIDNIAVFLDPDTLATIETAHLPPCTNWAVRDPTGDGFLATFGGTDPEIGRFDMHGNLVAHTAFPLTAAQRQNGMFATAIAVLDGPEPFAAATLTASSTTALVQDIPSLIFVTGTDPGLSFVGFTNSYGPRLHDTSSFGANAFAVIDDKNVNFSFLSPTTGDLVPGPSLQSKFISTDRLVGRVLLHPATSLALLSVLGSAGSVFVYQTTDPNAVPTRADYFLGASVDAWAMSPWPADSSLVLVGLTTRDPSRMGIVALMDPRSSRFLIDGDAIAGFGPIGRMSADASRVWATLPWTREIVRVSAAK
jgi:hypothetical protein